MGESTSLLMQAGICPELKQNIVLPGERCWLLCGQLNILGLICMAGNSLFALIITRFDDFTVSRSQKGTLLEILSEFDY